MQRVWALVAVLGIATLSLIKGYLGIDDASTVLLSTSLGAILGYYFRANQAPPPPEA